MFLFSTETQEERKARELKSKKDNAEYLRDCLKKTSKQVGLLSPDLWYLSGDTMLSVANILEDQGYLHSAGDAIRFFEKPYHFESDMAEIAGDLEEEIQGSL